MKREFFASMDIVDWLFFWFMLSVSAGLAAIGVAVLFNFIL